MSRLNKKQVKQFALDAAKARAHKFTRVGNPFTCLIPSSWTRVQR